MTYPDAPQVVLLPAGLDYNAGQTIPQNSLQLLSTFTSRSGFPTILNASSNGFICTGPGFITVTAKMTINISTNNSPSIGLFKNTVQQGSNIQQSSSASVAGTFPVLQVADGDLIQLYGTTTSALSGQRVVQSGSTNTFFYITVVSPLAPGSQISRVTAQRSNFY